MHGQKNIKLSSEKYCKLLQKLVNNI